jgi:signal transduction histidine kinase
MLGHSPLREDIVKRSVLLAAAASASILFSASLAWGAGGTAAEARALLEKAIAELKANEAAALAKFNKPDGGYRDRDLYVFCYDTTTGTVTAHADPGQLGLDVRALKEKDGTPLGQRMFDRNKAGTISSIEYKYPRPGTSEPLPKESFLAVVGHQGCGVGYYK